MINETMNVGELAKAVTLITTDPTKKIYVSIDGQTYAIKKVNWTAVDPAIDGPQTIILECEPLTTKYSHGFEVGEIVNVEGITLRQQIMAFGVDKVKVQLVKKDFPDQDWLNPYWCDIKDLRKINV